MSRSIILVSAFAEERDPHASHRQRALERLGHSVTPVDTGEPGGLLRMFRRRSFPDRLAEAMAGHPDTVVAIGVPELEPATLERMKRDHGAVWINWVPHDHTSWASIADVLPPYDVVLATGSDVAHNLSQRLEREVPVLPHAVDPSVFRPSEERDQSYRANVVFAGRATARRELLLAQLVEFGLALWGPGWRDTALRDYCRGERLATSEFVRAYAGASAAVNIHYGENGTSGAAGTSCNARLFEIASIGVPQVTDWREDLPSVFTPGVDVAAFRDAAEMKALVQGILHDPASAAVMAQAARKRVIHQHTWMHRLQGLEQWVGAAVG